MSGSTGFDAPVFERPKPVEKSRHTIHSNRWDDRVWEKARKTDSIDGLITNLYDGDVHRGGNREAFDPAPELVHDLYLTFYKAAPQLLPKNRVAPESYPVRRIIEEMMENPRLKDLQEMTSSDPAMSLMAVNAMSDAVVEIIGRVPPPPPPPGPGGKPGDGQGEGDEPLPPSGPTGGHPGNGEDGENGEGDKQESEGQAPDPGQPRNPGDEGEGDGDQEDGEGEGGGPEEFDPDSEGAADQEEADWQSQYDDLLDDLDLDRMINRALEDAADEAEELDRTRKGIGLDDGTWAQMSPEERLEMARRLSTPEMKTLSDIVGRMKRFALGVKATRVNDVPHEAYDVESGNDIRRLLRSEFALLGREETEYEFYRRYAEKELLQFKMRGKEDAGKGPIVIAIDKSGSMHGAPFNWAMGVAEALRRFAADEDRDYYAMFFGSNNDRNRFEFPKGKGPFEKVLTFLGVQANGGTQFDGVLTEALERASTCFDGEGKGKADIVFVTDGYANLHDSWIEQFNAERERVGVRVYSVYIGGAYDMNRNSGPVGLLNKISDIVIPVSDLRPESAQAIFQKV